MSQFEQKRTNTYWCMIHDRNIALINESLPYGTAKELGISDENAISIGEFEGNDVMWVECDTAPTGATFQPLRSLLNEEPTLFQLAGRAAQLSHMKQSMPYCSQCGSQTHFRPDLMAMACDSCRQWHYPRVSPCIIVAVRREGEILLAQHPRHRNGMYTVVAGFVEAGETLEQCVAREVKEETGIEVQNIRYIASQPWAFPSNLMMGFMADFAGGELTPDYTELSDAKWFKESELPPLAPVGTIARRLIEDTLAAIRSDQY